MPATHASGALWRRMQSKSPPIVGALASPPNAWSRARAVHRLLALAPATILGAARFAWASIPHGDTGTRHARRRAALRDVATDLLRVLAVRVVVSGPRPSGPVLYACNHLSWLDVLVLLVALPDCALIAKQEVAHWPLIGRIIRATDTVLVQRTPTRGLPGAIAEVSTRLSRGQSVVLFAEGTTSDGAQVLPFKSPFFEAAVHAGVPVVPVGLRASTGPGGPDVARHVCWWGDDTLAAHLPLVAGTRQIRYAVRVGEPLHLAHVPSLAPTRCAPAPRDADRALRHRRSLLRRRLALRAHDAVARQTGHTGVIDAADEQRRRLTVEQLLLQPRRELSDANTIAREGVPAHP
jgi:1-acyl-sn-glycerol-3-phosphate acyltransferase